MKIINLGRQQGKTTRLLYASEWQHIPILCATYQQKRYLMDMAKKLGLIIPEPIYVSEISKGDSVMDKDILIDEAPWVLQMLLKNIGMRGDVKAITLTSDEKVEDCNEYINKLTDDYKKYVNNALGLW